RADHRAGLLARLPRPRRAAAGRRMGRHDRRRPALSRHRLVDLGLPWPGDIAARPRLFPDRRRAGETAAYGAVSGEPFLSVADLAIDFATAQGPVPALRGVSFAMERGEVLGIVGESGSGKTVACRSVMRLLAANARIRAGRIRFEDQDVLGLDEAALGKLRGERMAMIFQNPSTHLDPLMPVGRQVGEALGAHHGLDAKATRRRAIELLADMRIPEPERRVDAYPHQLSGGMRQ